MYRGRGQVQQHDQDKESESGLLGYTMWKLDTKLEAWVSSDAGIYSDSSLVSSYPSQIILYRSLHAYWQSILESTIREISYLDLLSIITGAEAGCILLEKVLNMAGSSMDT